MSKSCSSANQSLIIIIALSAVMAGVCGAGAVESAAGKKLEGNWNGTWTTSGKPGPLQFIVKADGTYEGNWTIPGTKTTVPVKGKIAVTDSYFGRVGGTLGFPKSGSDKSYALNLVLSAPGADGTLPKVNRQNRSLTIRVSISNLPTIGKRQRRLAPATFSKKTSPSSKLA